MPRGGYRRPKSPQPPSGPGKFSKRTDGNQPVRVPGLAAGRDIQSGDVGMLKAAQQAVPIPRAGNPSSLGAPSPLLPQQGPGGVPPWLFQMGSSRPGEPASAGLPTGPGPGPEVLPGMAPQDDREAVLQYLAANFQNSDAAQLLMNIRAQRSQGQTLALPVAQQAGGPQPFDMALGDLPIDTGAPTSAPEPQSGQPPIETGTTPPQEPAAPGGEPAPPTEPPVPVQPQA